MDETYIALKSGKTRVEGRECEMAEALLIASVEVMGYLADFAKLVRKNRKDDDPASEALCLTRLRDVANDLAEFLPVREGCILEDRLVLSANGLAALKRQLAEEFVDTEPGWDVGVAGESLVLSAQEKWAENFITAAFPVPEMEAALEACRHRQEGGCAPA